MSWTRRTAMDDEQLTGGVMQAVTGAASSVIAIGGAPEGSPGAVWLSPDGSELRRVISVGSISDADRFGALLAADSGLVIAAESWDGHAAIWTSPPLPPSRNPRPVETPVPEIAEGSWVELAANGDVKRFIQVYCPQLDGWEVRPGGVGPMSAPPEPALVGRSIILFEASDADVEASAYDPVSNVIASAGPPLEGACHSIRAVAVPDGRVIVYAVDATLGRPHLAAFDPRTHGWAELAEPPGVVLGMTVSDDGRLYAFVEQQRMYIYNPLSDAWTGGARKPTTRGDFAMVSGPTGIYVVGGFTEGGPDGRVELYDPTSDRWAVIPGLPSPRSYPAAVAAPDGSIYVIGGTDARRKQTDAVEALEPPGLRLP